jgi:hypothetical protein
MSTTTSAQVGRPLVSPLPGVCSETIGHTLLVPLWLPVGLYQAELVALRVGENGGKAALVVEGTAQAAGAEGQQTAEFVLQRSHPQVQVHAVLALLGLGHPLQQQLRLCPGGMTEGYVRRIATHDRVAQGLRPERGQAIGVGAVQHPGDLHVDLPPVRVPRTGRRQWWSPAGDTPRAASSPLSHLPTPSGPAPAKLSTCRRIRPGVLPLRMAHTGVTLAPRGCAHSCNPL